MPNNTFKIPLNDKQALMFANLVKLTSIMMLFITLLVLIGWFFDKDVLKSINPEWASMKIQTAFGFIVLSVTLSILSFREGPKKYPNIFYGLSFLIILESSLVIFEYATEIELGIDFKGRMSLVTAFNFLCCGGVLWASQKNVRFAQFLVFIPLSISYIFILNYLFGEVSHVKNPLFSVALSTAFCFCLFGIGFLFLNIRHNFLSYIVTDSFGSIIFKQLFFTILVFIPFFSWLRLQAQKAGLFGIEFDLSIFTVSTTLFFGYFVFFTAKKIDESHIEIFTKDEELRLLSERLSLATKAGGVGVWDWDIVNNILNWDDQMLRLYDVSRDELDVGYDVWTNHLHPDDLERGNLEIQMALRNEKNFNTEFRVIWKNGSVHYIRALANVEFDSSNHPIRMVGTNWEVTEIKNNELLLLEAKKNAESLANSKSEFLANMSHEIRTPMNAILGLAYVLENDDLDVSEQRSLVKKIRNSGNSLLGIINDILDFSKIESGKLELEKVPFLLSDILSRLSTVMSFNSTKKSIDLLMAISPEIYDYQILGDSLRLEQVLTNLISNALKFTQNGHINLKVSTLELTTESIKIRFAIQDTGIGISSDALKHIFSPFSQADTSTTRSYGGTGLGLTISRKLVNLMGGEIKVESELGKGSTFFFDIQFDCIACNLKESNMQNHKPLAIQIVDDNPFAREALKMTVQSLGWLPNVYDSAQNLLESIQQSADLSGVFLLDFQMPDIDGLELAHRIKENAKISNDNPIIIMVTGQDRSIIKNHPYANEPDLFLDKPITPSSLYDAIALSYKNCNEFIQPDLKVSTDKALDGYKILVVDDSETNLDVATRIFSKQGAIIYTTTNGLDAIKWLKNHDPVDIVLMDLQMPIMNGYDATQRIREIPKLAHLPIIALSAGVLKSQIQKALDVGVNDFITKPFNVNEAIKTIQKFACVNSVNSVADTSEIETKVKQAENTDSIRIDFEKGLEIFAGEEDFYFENMKKFISESIETIQTVSSLSPKELEKLAHKWKGASSMLALNGISEAAKILELSLHHNENIDTNLMIQKLNDEIILAQDLISNYEVKNG